MASPSDNGTGEPHSSNLDDRLKARLDEVNRRLDPVRADGPGLSDAERKRRSSALGKAFRLSTELVAGVIVGGGIGWGLDKWLGTKPLFLVGLLILGVAAGLLNTVRVARQMERE